MPEQGTQVARIFPEMGVDAVVYACAETSFLGGVDRNQVVIEEIERSTSLPAVTATWAMVLALRHLGLARVALVTPYTEERGAVMEAFLERCGVSIARRRHKDFQVGSDDERDWYHTNLQPPQVAYRLARELGVDGADAVLVSATNFRTLEMIDSLERDLGVPVVTCNQAILWWLSQALRLGALGGPGRLLQG
jgi:maleate cis-trans isomerase